MKKTRPIMFLTFILAVIAGVLLVQNRKSTLKGDYKDFAITDTSNVTKIFLADKKNRTILLEKKTSGKWLVNGQYYARPDAIVNILEAMLRVEVKEPVPKAAHNNVVGRMSAIGVKVEIYQVVHRIQIFNLVRLFPRQKLTTVYYVGDATQDHLGTYMLMANSRTPYITYIQGFTGFLTPRFSCFLNDWRDHSIFTIAIDKIKSVKIEFPQLPETSYLVEKSGRKVMLVSLNNNQMISVFDTARLVSSLAYFRDIKFEALLEFNKKTIDSLTSEGPLHIITLTDTLNNQTIVKTFRKKAAEGELDLEGNPVIYDRDRLYASINDNEDFVLIQYFVFDNITRPLAYFLRGEDIESRKLNIEGHNPE